MAEMDYKIEFADRPDGGTVLHIAFVETASEAEAEAQAKSGFKDAQTRFGARCYRVLETGSKRIVARGPASP